jgi:hypothetical protein
MVLQLVGKEETYFLGKTELTFVVSTCSWFSADGVRFNVYTKCSVCLCSWSRSLRKSWKISLSRKSLP